MSTALTLISSMAVRQLTLALAQAHAEAGGPAVAVESVGGVDAARRVLAGEAFDVVVLASDAMARLDAAGRLRPGSLRAIADSSVAAAVSAGAAVPDISTKAALRGAVLAARSIGYSTGPSGTALLQLFARWQLADVLKDRLVQAPAGVPVSRLLADGEVELGFQQFSELMGSDGITLLGDLPPGAAITTRFSGAVTADAARPDAAQALLDFMARPDTAAIKQEHGMRSAAGAP